MTFNCSRQAIEELGHTNVQVKDETESTYLVRVLGSYDLRVLKDDISLTPHLYSQGFWEAWITSWFTKWIRPGMCVVDIGANCGYYTLLFEHLVGRYGNVVAYEPNPVYAELLRQSREANNCSFKIREVALSDHKGRAKLSVPGNLHGSASIVNDFKNIVSQVTEYDVRTTTLDAEARNLIFYRHDIIKIDAESAEQMIWNGGKSVWNDHSHTTVVMEWTPGAYTSDFVDEIFEWGTVSIINESGDETPASKDWLANIVDWQMLVIRRK